MIAGLIGVILIKIKLGFLVKVDGLAQLLKIVSKCDLIKSGAIVKDP